MDRLSDGGSIPPRSTWNVAGRQSPPFFSRKGRRTIAVPARPITKLQDKAEPVFCTMGDTVMAVQGTKLRLLYIYRILLEETDEEHILSAAALQDMLESRYQIQPDRRSIYSDIDTLKTFGLDIVTVKGSDHGFYIGERNFELAELKILVDSVQASKFITDKKTEQLIGKLKLLTSRHQAKALQKQVTLTNRPKATNETILYNVDSIHNAIYRNRQISFQYAEWTMNKKLALRRNGAAYLVSPWALVWDDEFYYMVAYDHHSQEERHYRVDKMRNIEILEAEREGEKTAGSFDAADFGKRTFGMFTGETERVTLYGKRSLAGVVLDRFGRDVMLVPADEDHFRVTVEITTSPQFFGWLTGLGGEIKILRPERVRKAYADHIRSVLANYKDV